MTIIACGDEYTEEDKKALDETERGYDSKMTQEVWGEFFEKHMPEVERAIEERFDQMMEQKNAEFVEKAEAIIEKDETSLPESLPAETPEEKELIKEMEGLIREELEAAEQEIRNLQPVKTIQEERKAMIEAGKKIGLPPRVYVNTADIVRFPEESVKEVMAILNHPEMPRCFTRRESIGQVQYVDRPDLYAATGKGEVTKTLLRKENGVVVEVKTLGIFILPDEKGRVPTGDILKGRIAHGIIHGNWPDIAEYIKEHKGEFDKVIARQIEERGLPPYALRKLTEITDKMIKAEKGERPPLTKEEKEDIEGKLLKETTAEMARYYFTDRSQLLPEAQRLMSDMFRHFQGY